MKPIADRAAKKFTFPSLIISTKAKCMHSTFNLVSTQPCWGTAATVEETLPARPTTRWPLRSESPHPRLHTLAVSIPQERRQQTL